MQLRHERFMMRSYTVNFDIFDCTNGQVRRSSTTSINVKALSAEEALTLGRAHALKSTPPGHEFKIASVLSD